MVSSRQRDVSVITLVFVFVFAAKISAANLRLPRLHHFYAFVFNWLVDSVASVYPSSGRRSLDKIMNRRPELAVVHQLFLQR